MTPQHMQRKRLRLRAFFPRASAAAFPPAHGHARQETPEIATTYRHPDRNFRGMPRGGAAAIT
jgi:hypothetical protein